MTKIPMPQDLILTNKAAPFFEAPKRRLDQAHAGHAKMLQEVIQAMTRKSFPASNDIREVKRTLGKLGMYEGPGPVDEKLDGDFQNALTRFRDRFGLVSWLADTGDDGEGSQNVVG